jgi:predicted component of viral defense system (DUF524 family)
VTLCLATVRFGDLHHAVCIDALPEDTHERDWITLDTDITARRSHKNTSHNLCWDHDANNEALCSLSLFDRARYLLKLPVGAHWSGASTSLVHRVYIAANGETLWSLEPRGHAGILSLTACFEDGQTTHIEAEVRTRAMDDRNDWRAMLDALTEADLALATRDDVPTEVSWTVGTQKRETSPWEQFVFLRTLIEKKLLSDALYVIAHTPIEGIIRASQLVTLDRGTHIRPEELAARGISHTDSRIAARQHGPMSTRDVLENHLCLTALHELVSVAVMLSKDLRLHKNARMRTLAWIDALERLLATMESDALRGVRVPQGKGLVATTKFFRTRGYREIAAMMERLREGSCLTRSNTHERLGLRDAPRLYERWCVLVLGELLQLPLEVSARLSLGGEHTCEWQGRRVTIATQQSLPRDVSYSMAFKPDILLTCDHRRLVMDAKYQLEDADITASDAPREALVKMHAYRDAIAHTWAACVLHPGHRGVWWDAPEGGGVGAIALRPSTKVRDDLRVLMEKWIGREEL